MKRLLSILLTTALICGIPLIAEAAPANSYDGNRDGRADLVARVHNANQVRSYLGNGYGSFPNTALTVGPFTTADYLLTAPNFSGAGAGDIITRDHIDHTLRLFRSLGNGQFTGGWVIGWGWQVMDMILSPGDFDGDGHADIVARKPDGTLWLYPGNGRGGFSNKRQIGWGWQVMDTILSPGDFDGDGRADIVARMPDGTLWLYPGNGRGGFSNKRQVGWGWQAMDLPGPLQASGSVPFPNPGPLPQPTPAPKPPAPSQRQPFVYGTLRTGQRGYEMILRGKTTSELTVTMAGRDMYRKRGGTVPYSVPGSGTLVGQEMWIHPAHYGAVMQRMDAYEHYNPNKPINSQAYYRTTATTSRGTPVWIYDATPRMATYLRQHGIKIRSGNWFNRNSANPLVAATKGPSYSAGTIDLQMSNTAAEPVCHNDLGEHRPENGEFRTFTVDLSYAGDSQANYLPFLPENFTIERPDGKVYPAVTQSAHDCAVGSQMVDAFIDAGAHANGVLIIDVNPDDPGILRYQPGEEVAWELDLATGEVTRPNAEDAAVKSDDAASESEATS